MTIDIDPNGPLSYLLDKPAIQTPNNALGKDAFLKLLVAQMKYQNPMEPTDSTEFISQTAQFTLVEQMENMAKSNADMLAGQLSATAASLIGKDVQWNVAAGDETEAPGEGTVQGVRVTADGPVLIVDGWEVPLQRVTAFGHAPQPDAEAGDDGTPPVDETTGGSGTPPVDETGDPPATDGSSDTDETDPSTYIPSTPEEVLDMLADEFADGPPAYAPNDPTAPAA
jgi:flagellar basal-body rod modification protein FlgD